LETISYFTVFKTKKQKPAKAVLVFNFAFLLENSKTENTLKTHCFH